MHTHKIITVKKVSILATRMDSDLVPWRILESSYELPKGLEEYPIEDDFGLFETDTWGFPISPLVCEVGTVYRFKGTLEITHYSYWTDCGTEYDASCEWVDYKIKKLKRIYKRIKRKPMKKVNFIEVKNV